MRKLFNCFLNFFGFNKEVNHSVRRVSITDFVQEISKDKTLDKKYVYVFIGSSSLIERVVGNPYGQGEKDLNDNSIIYPSVKTYDEKHNCLVLDDAMFIPMIVKDLKKYDGIERMRYVPKYGNGFGLKQAVICDENIYLVSKCE